MSVTNQSPLAFPSRERTSAPQPGVQIRPENRIPTTDDPEQANVKKAIRDTVDLLYQIRDAFTPLALYTQGDTTGAPILVPTAASAADLGTGVGLQVQLSRPGTWILGASVSLQSIGDTAQTFTLTLTVNNSPQALTGVVVPAGDGTSPIVQNWQVVSITGNESCTLKIAKVAGGGTSVVIPANSTMFGAWQGGTQ